jgi:primosomal protein N''
VSEGFKVHKKLNPGLFDEVSTNNPTDRTGTFATPTHGLPHHGLSPSSNMEVQRINEEVQGIKAKLRNYDNQMEVFKNQLTDFVHSFDQRFDRLSQALSRVEKSIHAQGRDTEDKLRGVREKIQSQGFEDAKVEGLIERQTVALRNFENRMAAMQKMLNEKELLIMKCTEALKQHGATPKK